MKKFFTILISLLILSGCTTHQSDAARIKQLRDWTPEAKQRAAGFGVSF